MLGPLPAGAFLGAAAFLDALDGLAGAASTGASAAGAVGSADSTTLALARGDLPAPLGSTTVSTSTSGGVSWADAVRGARLRARRVSSASGVRLTAPSQVSVLPPPATAVTLRTLSVCRWPRVRR